MKTWCIEETNKICLTFFFLKKYTKIKNKVDKITTKKKKVSSKLEYSCITKVIPDKIDIGKITVGKKAYFSRLGLNLLVIISLEIKILNAAYEGKT